MNNEGMQRNDEAAQKGAVLPVSRAVAAAHELKSPLALMRQLLLHLEDETLSPAQREVLVHRARLTAERGLRLTSDMTKAARIEDGALFNLEPLNPEQLCHDVVTELSPLFAAHGKHVSYKGRRSGTLLVANRDLLRRILLGFSDNALHYSQPGTPVQLSIRSVKKAGVVRVSVRDFGPALPRDMWRRLQQSNAATPQPLHARPESSGLGLMLAQQFAQAMNGVIGVIRHRDGATFYVELQASQQLPLW